MRKLQRLKIGDTFTLAHYNGLVDAINARSTFRGDGPIKVYDTGCGAVTFGFEGIPEPRLFQLTKDTISTDGFVTARFQSWDETLNEYTIDTDADEVDIYDPMYVGSQSVYGRTDRGDGVALWSRYQMLGRARFDDTRGSWVIDWIEHVARFITASITEDLEAQVGATSENAEVNNSWEGLDPSATGLPVTLLNSPDGGYSGKAGSHPPLGGQFYTSAPTVSFQVGSGATATAIINALGQVTGITINAGGGSYSGAPNIVFNGGGGTGAAATAYIAKGSVVSIELTSAGSGYASEPTIEFESGSGATATATISNGAVTGITITNGGSGYTGQPKLVFTGGGGAGAAGYANVSNGQVVGATLTNQGTPGTTFTAVWRNDLDNSEAWQYQIIDGPCATPSS